MPTERQFRDALDDLAATSRPPAVVLTRVLAHHPELSGAPRPPHRRRLALALTAAALVVLVLLGTQVLRDRTVPPATPAPVPTDRVAGNWTFTHPIDPPAGWRIDTRVISRDSEATALTRTAGADVSCVVQVGGLGVPAPRQPAPARAVEISGRSGVVGRDTQGRTSVVWPYADHGWATVTCTTPGVPEPVLLDLARRVADRPATIRLPYRLTGLDDGYEVDQLTQPGAADADTEVTLTDGQSRDDHPPLTITTTPGQVVPESDDSQSRTTVVNGRTTTLNLEDESVCVNASGFAVCVSGPDPAGDETPSQDYARRLAWQVTGEALAVQVAGALALDDPNGYDATVALNP